MARMGSDSGAKHLNDTKTQDPEQVEIERPTKRLKTFLAEDNTSDEDSVSSVKRGVPVDYDESETTGHGFKVNREFARRFEHNKKREELHKRE